jgi:amino acid adenylation domain-containing protein
MLVNEFLENSADKYPNKIALVCQGRKFTYSEMEQFANSLANGMRDGGLGKQERVGIYLDSSYEAVVSIFGVLKAGGVFFVVNPQVKASKIEYILNDCEASVLVTDARHFRGIADSLDNCPSLKSVIVTDYENLGEISIEGTNLRVLDLSEVFEEFSSERPEKYCIDIDLACLIYTSGSTGIPKGVMSTHQNVSAAASSIIEYLENVHEDIILSVLPLSFDYGLYQLLMAFKFGGTLILEKSFIYPYPVVDLLVREKATGFPIVPTMAAILLKLKDLEKYDFSNLRYISSTAQAFPPQHIDRLREIFPHTRIYSMYGLTECKRVSYLPPGDLDRKPGSVGIAMPNTEVYIVDEKDNKITDAGVVGELVVRGANVMRGYWNLPEETAKVYRPGPLPGEKVLYTGDLFKMDGDGYLYFVGRVDDMLKVAGERVSPKEIENVLYDIEGVNEAAVVGVEDEILGHAAKAFVSLKKGAELGEDDIMRYCSRHMEGFMVPKYVEILAELPKSSHGKIAKKELDKK